MSLPEIPGEPPAPRVIYVNHYSAPMRHGWMKFVIKDLETNPQSQFNVHKWGAVYWLINFPIITALYIFEPHLWLALGIFITLIYSIYANFRDRLRGNERSIGCNAGGQKRRGCSIGARITCGTS